MKSNAAKKAIGVLKEWSIVLALILVWAVLSFLSPHFLQWSNISNIFLQSSHITARRRPPAACTMKRSIWRSSGSCR